MNNLLQGVMKRAPISSLIMAVCIVVWLVTVLQTGRITGAPLGMSLGQYLALWGPPMVNGGAETLRVLTAPFLHLDAVHLMMNMVMLAIVSWHVEPFVGRGVYMGVWIASSVGSAAAVVYANPLVPTAGASGCLFALMVIMVAVLHRLGEDIRSALVLLAVNIGYTLLGANVSVAGHLGGCLMGLVLAGPVTSHSQAVRWGGVALGLILGVAAFIHSLYLL